MKKGLKIFLWIFFLPVMAIIAVAKSPKLGKPAKIAFISVIALISFAAIGLSGNQDTSVANGNNGSPVLKAPETESEREPEPKPEVEPEPELADEIKILVEKGISQEHSIIIYNKLVELGTPLWNKSSVILIENTNPEDYIVTYTTTDGIMSQTFALHMLSGQVNSLVDSNLEVIFDANGVNPNYVYHKDIEYDRLKSHTEDLITSILKSPSTAKYPGSFFNPLEGWEMGKKGNIISLKSYVDSQNSFGAMLRSNFLIEYKKYDGGYDPVYVIFDDKVVLDER